MGTTSPQSTVMLNTHCTFLRTGYRAHVQTNQEMRTCRGIPVPFYKCSPRTTHKMQSVWVKTSDSNVKDIATKERCTTYNGTLKLSRSLKKSWGGDWNRGHDHYCLNVISAGRVWFMKLAKVESWNYFLDIKINPRSASTFISRCKKESLAPLAKTLLNPHFWDRIFFPPLL